MKQRWTKPAVLALLLLGLAPLLCWSVGDTRQALEGSGTTPGAGAFVPRIIFEADSPYTHVVVTEDMPGLRSLRFQVRGGRQSQVQLGQPLQLRLPYVRAFMVSLALVPEPKRVMIVGLGGGSMAMFLRTLYPEIEVDAADIDPVVVDVAERYLDFKRDPKTHVYVEDGRKVLERSAGSYDLILLDAFAGDDVPKHLITIEFMATVRQKLSDRGLAVANVWRPSANRDYFPILRNWQATFGACCVLDIPDTPNTVYLGRRDGTPPTPAPEELMRKLEQLRVEKRLPFDLRAYVRRGCAEQPIAQGPLLRDADLHR